MGFLNFASSVHNHDHWLWGGLVVLNLHLVKSRFEAYLAHGLTKSVDHLSVDLRLENLAFSRVVVNIRKLFRAKSIAEILKRNLVQASVKQFTLCVIINSRFYFGLLGFLRK